MTIKRIAQEFAMASVPFYSHFDQGEFKQMQKDLLSGAMEKALKGANNVKMDESDTATITFEEKDCYRHSNDIRVMRCEGDDVRFLSESFKLNSTPLSQENTEYEGVDLTLEIPVRGYYHDRLKLHVLYSDSSVDRGTGEFRQCNSGERPRE